MKPNQPGNKFSFVRLIGITLITGLVMFVIGIIYFINKLPHVTVPSLPSFPDIPHWIWIVLIVLIAAVIVWKFFPSIKLGRVPKWVWYAVVIVALYFSWPYLRQYLTHNHENDYPNIPTITYGLGQHMDGNKWYKYRFVDNAGNHLNVYVTPQSSDTYVDSKRLDIDGIWAELKINQDDTVDITKTH